MQLPLVAVVGDTQRVPDRALDTLSRAWRFRRAPTPDDLLGWNDAPQVVILASPASRSFQVVRDLRDRLRPTAVLLGFGEDSSELDLPLDAVDGWVQVPVTAQALGTRLAQWRASQPVPLELALPTHPPRQLGAYRLGRRLGVGSFGTVYEAIDTRDGTTRAIKVAHTDVLTDPESRARWRREARLLQQVRLPGVVNVHGSGEVDGFLCLVMDLLAGVALQDHVDLGEPLSTAHLIAVAERLGRALGALHALGVIHRDIKPANVVFDPATGLANLTDLGLAVHLRSQALTASDVVLGTAGYLAPERIRGERGGAASDAYALGATLYYALTGHAPYRDKSPLQLIRRVAQGEPAPPLATLRTDVPAGLAKRIDGLIHPDPAARLPLSDLVDWCYAAGDAPFE